MSHGYLHDYLHDHLHDYLHDYMHGMQWIMNMGGCDFAACRDKYDVEFPAGPIMVGASHC